MGIGAIGGEMRVQGEGLRVVNVGSGKGCDKLNERELIHVR